MVKGILLGNGINNRIGIDSLSTMDIKNRFQKNMIRYAPMFVSLFNVEISNEISRRIINMENNKGIELLATSLYKYIKTQSKKHWTDKDEIRIQEIITCLSLVSIFYTEKGKIDIKYRAERLLSFSNYEFLYSLNYVEFWDVNHKCIHLHGKVDLDKLEDSKNVVFVNKHRMNLEEYRQAVECMKKNNCIQHINPSEIIFAPSDIKKEKLFCVTGVYPSTRLYPAKDMFLYRGKELYTELKYVEELDVFGVSPYGDKSLIDAINQKKRVKIFVYNKNENAETEEWERILTCPYQIFDSEEIL